ncbi:MAG: hypothetical protein C0472_09320 [Erythrobacter sp.]|nr:hypothetical protein [Erythrobacter sp.]
MAGIGKHRACLAVTYLGLREQNGRTISFKDLWPDRRIQNRVSLRCFVRAALGLNKVLFHLFDEFHHFIGIGARLPATVPQRARGRRRNLLIPDRVDTGVKSHGNVTISRRLKLPHWIGTMSASQQFQG